MICASAPAVVDHRPRWRGARPLSILILSLWLPLCAAAQSQLDAGSSALDSGADDDVLVVLPQRLFGTEMRWQALREALAAQPDDPTAAAALAQAYIEFARRQSEPRYLGYARALLGPWWSQSAPPDEVLLLRATLHQGEHRFAAAMSDLDQLIARRPRHAQAWLTRATIQRVRGEHAAALASCFRLSSLAGHAIAARCLAGMLGLGGRAERGLDLLRGVTDQRSDTDTTQRQWHLTLMGELYEQLGHEQQALQHYRRALALPPRNPYLLRTTAELLRQSGQPGEALALLRHETRDDALLLQAALAARALGETRTAREYAAQLALRLREAELRGSQLHQRIAARHALYFADDPQAALQRARANWRTQKEPLDAQVLAEAALAAGDADSLVALRQWLAQSKLQAPRLRALLASSGEIDA